MLKVWRYLSGLFLLWLILFLVNRIVFLVLQSAALARLSFAQILLSFYYALPLDVSAACYSCALPFILLWIALVKKCSR